MARHLPIGFQKIEVSWPRGSIPRNGNLDGQVLAGVKKLLFLSKSITLAASKFELEHLWLMRLNA